MARIVWRKAAVPLVIRVSAISAISTPKDPLGMVSLAARLPAGGRRSKGAASGSAPVRALQDLGKEKAGEPARDEAAHNQEPGDGAGHAGRPDLEAEDDDERQDRARNGTDERHVAEELRARLVEQGRGKRQDDEADRRHRDEAG